MLLIALLRLLESGSRRHILGALAVIGVGIGVVHAADAALREIVEHRENPARGLHLRGLRHGRTLPPLCRTKPRSHWYRGL